MPCYTRGTSYIDITTMKKFIINDIGTTSNPERERYKIIEVVQNYNIPTPALMGLDMLVSDHEDTPCNLPYRSMFRRNPNGSYTSNRLVFARIIDIGMSSPTLEDEVIIEFVPIIEAGIMPGMRASIKLKYLSVVETITETSLAFNQGDIVRMRENDMSNDMFPGDAEYLGDSPNNPDCIQLRLHNGDLWNFRRRDLSHIRVVQRVKDAPKVIEKLTIGSDIEFSFIKDGKQVNVREAMVESFRETGEVGTDHSGGVGEFRPQFGNNPIEHVANLKKAIRHVIEGGYMREDTFLDSSHISGNHVLGGHIHFGVTDPVLVKRCQKNLDYWLLPTVQPLFPKEVFLKRVSGYGRLGSGNESIRMQPHGFEYRLVPSFLFNEGIAKGIFCLAYVIVKLTIEGKLKVRMDETDQQWKDNFMKNYNEYGLTELNSVREEAIKKLLNKNLVGDYIKYINPLFDAIKYKAEFSGDIAEGWGLEYEYVLNRRSEDERMLNFIRQRVSPRITITGSPF